MTVFGSDIKASVGVFTNVTCINEYANDLGVRTAAVTLRKVKAAPQLSLFLLLLRSKENLKS